MASCKLCLYRNVFNEDIDPVPAAAPVSEPQGSSSSDEFLVFISEPHSPIRQRSKHRGKGRGWLKVEGSPLGPTVKASCLAPH